MKQLNPGKPLSSIGKGKPPIHTYTNTAYRIHARVPVRDGQQVPLQRIPFRRGRCETVGELFRLETEEVDKPEESEIVLPPKLGID